MNENKSPTLTSNEIKQVRDTVFSVCIFKEAMRHAFGKDGYPLFCEVMQVAQDETNQFFTQKCDVTKIDTSILYRHMTFGGIAQYCMDKHLPKKLPAPTHIGAFIKQFFHPDNTEREIKIPVANFSWFADGGWHCQEEYSRRLESHPLVCSMIRLASNKLSPQKEHEYLQTAHSELSGIMKEKFVLSEIHASEHEQEKESVLNLALTQVLHDIKNKMDIEPSEVTSQVLSILNKEPEWRGKKNPLLYLPNAIKNKFLNLVDDRLPFNQMVWLDDSHSESDVSTLEAGADEALQSPPNLDKVHPEEEVNDLLREIQTHTSERVADIAQNYYKAHADHKKRPTQADVGKEFYISDRHVRREIDRLRIFLEHKLKKK